MRRSYRILVPSLHALPVYARLRFYFYTLFDCAKYVYGSWLGDIARLIALGELCRRLRCIEMGSFEYTKLFSG